MFINNIFLKIIFKFKILFKILFYFIMKILNYFDKIYKINN